jgi:hypothetical protein
MPSFVPSLFLQYHQFFTDEELLNLKPLDVSGKLQRDFFGYWICSMKERSLIDVEMVSSILDAFLERDAAVASRVLDIIQEYAPRDIVQNAVTSIGLRKNFGQMMKVPHLWTLLCWMGRYSEEVAHSLASTVLENHYGFEKAIGAISAVGSHLLMDSSKFLDRDLKNSGKKLCQLHVDAFSKVLKRQISGVENMDGDDIHILGIFLVTSSKTRKVIVKRLNKYILKELQHPSRLFSIIIEYLNQYAELGEFCLWIVSCYLKLLKKQQDDPCFSKSLECVKQLAISLQKFPIGNADLIQHVFDTCLRYQISTSVIHELLISLVPGVQVNLLRQYVSMITTHSAYTTIMEESKQGKNSSSQSGKASLLKLIMTILQSHPAELCNVEILQQLLKYFYGTKSEADQIMIQLIALFEGQHISVVPYIALWGNQALAAGVSYNLNESLNQIDPQLMMHTIHWYQVSQKNISNVYSSGLGDLYDPEFFLNLVATILDQKIGTLDAHRMIESNIIGLAMVSLSHESLKVRKTAHFVLAEFFTLLLESDIKERNQTLLLLEMLRNAIVPTDQDSHPIIPSLITMFFAHAISILIKPESFLYPLVNKFTLQRPIIDLEDVPMFYELFYSSHEQNRMERMWILKLLLHGLKTPKDYVIFQRRHVITILFDYFQSPIADIAGKKLVLQVHFFDIAHLQS